MSQTFQTIDLEPQPQKPMVAHLHDSSQQTSSAQQVCFNERHPQDLRIVLLTQKLQPSARNPINAEPQVSMRGGGIIGDAYVTTTSNIPDNGTTLLRFRPATSPSYLGWADFFVPGHSAGTRSSASKSAKGASTAAVSLWYIMLGLELAGTAETGNVGNIWRICGNLGTTFATGPRAD